MHGSLEALHRLRHVVNRPSFPINTVYLELTTSITENALRNFETTLQATIQLTFFSPKFIPAKEEPTSSHLSGSSPGCFTNNAVLQA